ncbi:MAG: thiamine pyrophosphate-dependent enzyme [Gammaproteobacteria bacterium]
MTDNQQITGGQAVVRALLEHGVDTLFGLPGAQTYALFDALYEQGDRIRYIGARHEQGAAYMAFGYARSTGRSAVYSVVPGPGVLNTGAALATAYGANSPLLCLTGQIPSAAIGRGRGHLHELPDQLATLRSITKWADRINHPAEAPGKVAEAFSRMRSDRPRPVALEIPWDILTMQAEVPALAAAPAKTTPEPEPQQLAAAAKQIKRAQQPMIMVGGGAMDAGAEILELARLIQAPVVPFRSGRGIVGNDSPFGLTCAEGYRLWPGTDLLIGIGTRLELPTMRWMNMPDDMPVIRIDIDEEEMQRLPVDIGLVGDAAITTRLLLEALSTSAPKRDSRENEFTAVKESVQKDIQRIQPQMDYLGAIRDVLPRDGIFVDELCQAGYASWFGFPVYEPRTFISCGYQGTLGYGFNTALGVKVAHPDKPVVAITGDGGFLFGIQELATAVQYRIGLVTIVFNNNAYGNVRRDQQNKFNGHVFGSDLHNPDFMQLVESFGAAAWRADSPRALRDVLKQAMDHNGPAVIEVPIEKDSEASPWDFIMPGTY